VVVNQIPRHPAPVVELEPAEEKIVEAIAFVIAEAERRGLIITQYDIIKTLFFADKSHLNTYGRPVIYDNYVAMPHGPVPSLAYDLLKGWTSGLRHHRLDSLPWSRRAAPEISPSANIFFSAKRDFNEDVLSESDVEALRDALIAVKSLTFGQIKRLTHEDPAYIDAWHSDESLNTPMSYALLFESPDEEMAEIVAYLSRHREPHDW
jgi:hypothetical protein